MDDLKLSTMIGNALGTGAAVAVLLLLIARIAKGVVERWIASLDALKTEIADHTKRDLDSHRQLGDRVATGQAELRESVVRLDAKFDSALDWLGDRTPVTDPGRDTAPHRRRRREPPNE